MARSGLKAKQRKQKKHSSKYYTRCQLCGRARAVMRRFGICRICFREKAHKGEIPGLKKASW